MMTDLIHILRREGASVLGDALALGAMAGLLVGLLHALPTI